MTSPRTKPSADVKVRMYRQGFGDCFLLSLPSTLDRPFFMMIDCGVLFGTERADERMQAVVGDVRQATGGRLDLLVITHEHWDHVSGFLQARELFSPAADPRAGGLQIDALWLAWTENPNDPLARQLGEEREKTERALHLAVQRLREAEIDAGRRAPALDADEHAAPSVSDQVASVLSFFGASGRASTRDALDAARGYAARPPRYLGPGDPPFALDAVPGVRFYVLGPPRDEKLLKKSHPSKARPEVYNAALGLNAESAFFSALSAAEDEPFAEWQELSRPFDRSWRIPLAQAQQLPFFKRHYWAESDEVDYRDQSWRRIDSEWLRTSEGFALKLDDDTNNTSLVLALELVDSGKVLLFPGDAQVGNWLSWQDLSWSLGGEPGGGEPGDEPGGDEPGGVRTVNAAELLARTVLYKVGHHGSHNATLREKGLELMQHEELAAMMPVSRQAALQKGWRKIPFEPLLNRLLEKTRGRVLRADAPTPAAAPAEFRERVRETELYFELSVG